MEKPAGAALKARTYLSRSSRAGQECKETSYCLFVNYLLAMYETDNITAKSDIVKNEVEAARQ